MSDDKIPATHRRALNDYKIALGLVLRDRRNGAGYSFEELASHSAIPAETLRSYERGSGLPQLVRLASLATVYRANLFELLGSAAEYVYRANGESPEYQPEDTADRRALRTVILYCGVTPAQLRTLEMSLPSNEKSPRNHPETGHGSAPNHRC